MVDNDDLPYRDEAESDRTGASQVGGHAGGQAHEVEREHEKRRLFERVMPEILKKVVERAVESGASRLAEGPENLRNFVNEMKLPKEVLHYLYQQIDDTKNGIYRVVAKEIRDVLEQTQFADEITKVLTKLSFEIKTEIRFIPNDASTGGRRSEGDDEDTSPTRGFPKPEVSARVSVKDRSGKRPFSNSTPPPPPGAKAPIPPSGAKAPAPDATPPAGPRRREDT